MDHLKATIAEELHRVRGLRDDWRSKYYAMREKRDKWRRIAHDLQLQLEEAKQPRMIGGRYVTEEDRLEARRRSYRDSQRRRRSQKQRAA